MHIALCSRLTSAASLAPLDGESHINKEATVGASRWRLETQIEQSVTLAAERSSK